MRTTLTLDDDVAAMIERIRRAREASLKDIVNEALRRGLSDLATAPNAANRSRQTTSRWGDYAWPA